MDRNALEFVNISKAIKPSQKKIVSNINATIKEGEFVTILGSSGSGKTTLLKMINRILEPTEGNIFFFGSNVKVLPIEAYRRKIGYVIQQIGLFPHMSVSENIEILPKILQWSRSKIDARVDELLNLVGLPPNEYRKRFPIQLSGGQQQRVGIARALASNPAVLLMDEPFGALDALTRQTLQDELLLIQQKYRKTILFVTHDVQEAFKLGSKVMVMHNGEIQQFDTPHRILFEPKNTFVSQLISSDDVLQRLKIIQASSIAKPLQRIPLAREVCLPKNVCLDQVLSSFIRFDCDSILLENTVGHPVSEISWQQFKERFNGIPYDIRRKQVIQ